VLDLLCTPWRDREKSLLGEPITWARQRNAGFVAQLVIDQTIEVITEAKCRG
jgi:hypothetical protein